ncbi:MAG: glycosyltransferase [Candidatus Methylomirabilales bacterium]
MAKDGKRKITILFLIDEVLGLGGTETHVFDVAGALNKEMFDCVICSFDLERIEDIAKVTTNGVHIAHFPVGRLYGWSALKGAIQLATFIRRKRVDVVQTFHFKSDTYGALVAKLGGGAKVISSRRDLGELKGRRHVIVHRLVNPLVDHFIMVCHAVNESVTQRESIPSDKTTVIYNGKDLGRFAVAGGMVARSWREELGIGQDEFVIGNVGYFREEKGHATFLEGLKYGGTHLDGWRALLLGDGTLGARLKLYCKENGLAKRVMFVGAVEDVRKYVGVTDVICLSPGKNEGLSNAILEGMAMGKAVIATNVGGNAEAVVDGVTGIIVPPNDPEALWQAIFRLYKDAGLRGRMGRRGRERVEEKFPFARMIRQMEELYLRLCGEAKD